MHATQKEEGGLCLPVHDEMMIPGLSLIAATSYPSDAF
jgi:hypothetical protein